MQFFFIYNVKLWNVLTFSAIILTKILTSHWDNDQHLNDQNWDKPSCRRHAVQLPLVLLYVYYFKAVATCAKFNARPISRKHCWQLDTYIVAPTDAQDSRKTSWPSIVQSGA